MSTEKVTIEPLHALSIPAQTRTERRWLTSLRSSLWMCLLLALTVRIWLIIHTHGVIAGDEAMVGIQAEHILRGEHPLYYYSQSYMGSLEAYFLAITFAIVGPSVAALRATAMIVSLALVYLTWKFAGTLADGAQLSPLARRNFRTIATLVAALPPLYDAVLEMRTMGGYIEAFVIMLWLLFSAFRLTKRWQAGAPTRELALRWAGIGFLCGLGFWTDPLVVYAVAAIVLWMGWYCIAGIVKTWRQRSAQSILLKGVLLSGTAIPAALIGSAPAIYWGAFHSWANIHYIFTNGGTVHQHRLTTILQVQNLYTTCLAPRVLGGSLPTQPDVIMRNPQLMTFGLGVSVICLLIVTGSNALSFFWQQPTLVRTRQLTSLPLLFVACTSIVYCLSSIAVGSLYAGCGSWDLTGRYVVPLVIALPFFIAAVFTLPAMSWQARNTQINREGGDAERISPAQAQSKHQWWPKVVQGCFVIVLVIYFCTQIYAYAKANAGYTFQTSGCVEAPADSTPVIDYMRRQHIRYAWATGWIADPLTFKTNGTIMVTEPHSRIKADSYAVEHADRPSILLLAKHDANPPLLHALNAEHVTYRVARFPSEPGFDILVLTPLSRTVSPFEPGLARILQPSLDGCY